MYKISVIILAYNKLKELKLSIPAFELQSFDKADFEVIVVDDGSVDGSIEFIEAYKSDLNLKLLILPHSGNRGLSRSQGIKNATGDALLFIDGDMIPDIDFVRFHWDCISRNPKSVSMGIRNRLDDFNFDLISTEDLNFLNFLRGYPAHLDERYLAKRLLDEYDMEIRDKFFLLFSHNFCLMRSEFEAVGGFDERYSKLWGVEDVDLGYRLVKNGCSLVLNHQIVCYHVNHPENWFSKLAEFKVNLSLFLTNNPDWKIELFTQEYKIWSFDFLNLYKKIENGSHVDRVSVTDYCHYREQTCLFLGMDLNSVDQLISQSWSVLPYSSTQSSSFPGTYLGLKLPFVDKQFQKLVVSKKYLTTLPGSLFEIILKECQRVSNSVEFSGEIPLDLDKEFGYFEIFENIVSYKPAPRVIINPTPYTHMPFNKYWHYKLAIALHEKGVITSIRFPGDTRKQIVRDSDRYYLENKSDRVYLKRMFEITQGYLEDTIPSIFDNVNAGHFGRAIGQRYLWTDIAADFMGAYFNKSVLTNCEHFLYRKSKDHLGGSTDQKFLPVGIDFSRIDKWFIPTITENTQTTFLFAPLHSDPNSNIDKVIMAFKSAFEFNDNVSLHIISSTRKSFILDYNMESDVFWNEPIINWFSKATRNNKMTDENYLNLCKDIAGGDPRISFEDGVFGDDQMCYRISKCDVLIDIPGELYLNPQVFDAVCLCKIVLSTNLDCYKDYFTNQIVPIEFSLQGGAARGPFIEQPFYKTKSELTHHLYRSATVDAIAGAMTHSWNKIKSNCLIFDDRALLRRKYSWESIANSAIDFLNL